MTLLEGIVLNRTQIEAAIWETTKKPDYADLRLTEKRQAEDRAIAETQARTTARLLLDWLRINSNYKVMVRLMRGGYRNMSYESDWDLLLKDLGVVETYKEKQE